MFSTTNLLDALANCVVPALRRDVVEAGLVRVATVALDREAPGAGIPGVPARYVVTVVLGAPTGDDAANAQLRAAVENRLLGMPEISQAHVTMLAALFPILGGR